MHRFQLNLNSTGYSPAAGTCEHGTEHVGATNNDNFLISSRLLHYKGEL